MRESSPVDPGPIGAPRIDLQFEQQTASVVQTGDHLGANDGLLGACLDEWPVAAHPMRTEPREVFDRLHEVGLTLAVGALEDRYSRSQAHIGLSVIAELVQLETSDVHDVSSAGASA